MFKDELRLERIRAKMADAGFDLLVCVLPENVLYLTNFWPIHGLALGIMPKDGEPILFVPEVETENADRSWAKIVPFGWGRLGDKDQYTALKELLQDVRKQIRLDNGTIGLDEGFEVLAPPYRAAEPIVSLGSTKRLVQEVFPKAEVKDAAALLQGLRAKKTAYELERIKLANEIACMGLATFIREASPGKTEAEVAAAVEETIRSIAPGYKCARLARAFAEVRTGLGTYETYLLVPSRARRIREGDLVMIELATVVDGYWSDLTRTIVVGEPTKKQLEVHKLVLEAQAAAIEAVKPGANARDVDLAARQVIEKGGYGEYFVHITGHGIGLRYHEFVPLLHPHADGRLEPGMVFSVEPGIYIPGWGGVRIEDNVVVTETGREVISTFSRELPQGG